MSEYIFAQDVETAVAGNGGGANASANGGAAALGDINSGANAGNAIGVGDTMGSLICDKYGKCYPAGDGGVAVDGGDVANATNVGVTVNGGTAIADASGGNYNVAFVS
jgi:hypothetical protein